MPWQLNTDGGSRGNPGVAGIGISLAKDGEERVGAGCFIGTATNNHAEYCALIWGLENALALGVRELAVQADSELMVKQMNGAYRVKNPDLKALYARAQRLAARFEAVSFAHVRRERNKRADALANEAMDACAAVGNPAVAFSSDEDALGTGSLFAAGDASPDGTGVQGCGAVASADDAPACDDAASGHIEAPAAGAGTAESSAHDAPGADASAPGAYAGKTVLVGVTGGIAAYKACLLVRTLQQRAAGIEVKTVMTEHACEFVGPTTFRALTGHEVAVGAFDEASAPIHHISLAREADCMVIAPATANVIAKLAGGIADDLLTTTALATTAPVLLAPAMNAAMWADAATQENIARCRALGYDVIGPDAGYLACAESGAGRMAEPAAIAARTLELLATSDQLAGTRVLVTAGPTHEPLDPVRYLGNRSSGRQGYAVAEEALSRGAEVTLVTGPVDLVAPYGAQVVRVQTAREMLEACREPFAACDIAVFVAAVADYRPARERADKLKRSADALSLELVANPDIAATLAAEKGARRVVVFAAETGSPVAAARAKLAAKHADLCVANDVSAPDAGFGSPDNHVWLVDAHGERELPTCSKRAVAAQLFDALAAL